MASELVLHTKEVRESELVEVKIWRVPVTKDKPHGVKLSLVYCKDGKRLLGYDNAEGKGYHRHMGNKEEACEFHGIRQLLQDFKRNLTRIRGRQWDED